MRVAFFYNTSITLDESLVPDTKALLSTGIHCQVEVFPYKEAKEFCDLYRANILNGTSRWDLVLGPSDSASLKLLDATLTTKVDVPFIAPFITTSPEDYLHLQLISASPTDRDRVSLAAEQFIQYAGPRAVAIVHTDDPWGRGIVKHLREQVGRGSSTAFHAQPVEEFKSSDTNTLVRPVADNREQYRTFIQAMRKQGATVLVICLLTEEAANQLLEMLHKCNNDLLVKYKPSIVVFKQPKFDETSDRRGILLKYLREFNIFHISQQSTVQMGDQELPPALIGHLDACKIIARAAELWPEQDPPVGNRRPAAHYVLRFYERQWPQDDIVNLSTNLQTGFHAAKLGFDVPALAVLWSKIRGKQVIHERIEDYFASGRFSQLLCSGWFFLLHHRALWNPWTLSFFITMSWLSFVYVIQNRAMRPFWILWRTWAFWQLFLLNFFITYVVWILSIQFGIFEDANLIASIGLAAFCPTAASALGDVVRRHLPIDLSGIIRMIEELNEILLRQIGDAKINEAKEYVKRASLEKIKSRFFEVLFIDLQSDTLRNRLRERLRKLVDQLKDKEAQGSQEDLERALYASLYITATGYLCRNEAEMWDRLEKAGFVAPQVMNAAS